MQSPSAEPAAVSHSLQPGIGFDPATHRFRYYDFVMAAFVTVLLLSNVIGAAKPTFITIAGQQWVYGAGILFFPLGYVIGDVLTEGTRRHSERTRIMFSLSQFNTNLVAAICAFATSALFIGLSVGPAEIGTMSAMIV